jgi:hypothetical protein
MPVYGTGSDYMCTGIKEEQFASKGDEEYEAPLFFLTVVASDDVMFIISTVKRKGQ